MNWKTAKAAATELSEGKELGPDTLKAVGTFMVGIMDYQMDEVQRLANDMSIKIFIMDGFDRMEARWIAITGLDIFIKAFSDGIVFSSDDHLKAFKDGVATSRRLRPCLVDPLLYADWTIAEIKDASIEAFNALEQTTKRKKQS